MVSPASFGHTVGRPLTPGVDFHQAELRGYGRRWNYGVMSRVGESIGPDGTAKKWTIVALGLVESFEETVNGAMGWVTDDELPLLDRREGNYDRVDVTSLVSSPQGTRERVVTYVPRVAPCEWYAAARSRGMAAVEQRYWDLVDDAFAALGSDHHERYHATTPAPDVPIVAMRRDSVPMRHRVR